MLAVLYWEKLNSRDFEIWKDKLRICILCCHLRRCDNDALPRRKVIDYMVRKTSQELTEPFRWSPFLIKQPAPFLIDRRQLCRRVRS